MRIFCRPGFGRAGSPPNASAALSTPEDALWKTGAAIFIGSQFGRVGTTFTARDQEGILYIFPPTVAVVVCSAWGVC